MVLFRTRSGFELVSATSLALQDPKGVGRFLSLPEPFGPMMI
jgi:hypothetical protein